MGATSTILGIMGQIAGMYGAGCNYFSTQQMEKVAKELVVKATECSVDFSGMEGGLSFDTVEGAVDSAAEGVSNVHKLSIFVGFACLVNGLNGLHIGQIRMKTLQELSQEAEGINEELEPLKIEKELMDDKNIRRLAAMQGIIEKVDNNTATRGDEILFTTYACKMQDELVVFNAKLELLLAKVHLKMQEVQKEEIQAAGSATEQAINAATSGILFASSWFTPGGLARIAGLLTSAAAGCASGTAMCIEIANYSRCKEILKELQEIEVELLDMRADVEGGMKQLEDLQARLVLQAGADPDLL